MSTITLDELAKAIPALGRSVVEEDEVLILSGKTIVARIVQEKAQEPRQPRQAGLCKGQLVVPEDFNEPFSVR